jgi:transcription elongation factor Elf1
MKCYICGTELISTTIDHRGKEIPAMKCPECNDEYTTIIDAKYLKEIQNR